MASELFPIVSTSDLQRALAFYRDLLGGQVTYQFAGPDGQPVYVGLDVGKSHVGVALDPSAPGRGVQRASMVLWAYVDDCDAVVERFRLAGVEIVEEPTDQPWGERVARVRDPDGNDLLVGARSAARPERHAE